MNQLLQYPWASYKLNPIKLTLNSLEANWHRLHIGNSEKYPSTAALTEITQQFPILAASIGSTSLNEISLKLQSGWLNFHQGNYQEATKTGLSVGLLGLNLASKSMAIYATHLEPNESLKLNLFLEAVKLADHAIEVMPTNPDAHYNKGYALGRYSQGISITKALAEGHGKEVRRSLEKTLELSPEHAEAQVAFGTYHAEIIDQVGKLVASISYGANKDSSLKHFRSAIRIAPDFPIAYTQYADGLLMMFGPSKLKDAQNLYDKAASSLIFDAMEQLDRQAAIDELAEIQ